MAKRSKKSNAAHANEDKFQRFQRLATARMVKTRKAIAVIGNLSGSAYGYTPEQVEFMRSTLQADIEEIFAQFNRPPKAERARVFEFPPPGSQ